MKQDSYTCGFKYMKDNYVEKLFATFASFREQTQEKVVKEIYRVSVQHIMTKNNLLIKII